jgi:glutamine synthetase
LVEARCRGCLYAGIWISGINAEVISSQRVFQVGHCEGISMGDELWVVRHLIRAAKQWGVKVSIRIISRATEMVAFRE